VPSTVCPFCFRRIDSSHLAYQCTGRGNVECKKEVDETRKRLTGSQQETFPTFLPAGRTGLTTGRSASVECPTCAGPARRRACPECHTALPIDFVDSRSPMIGLVGAKGSGKTVLMTVLVKQLREVVGRRFGADIRIATDNPDGMQGISEYQASRETPLYSNGRLPVGTAQQGSAGRKHTTPVVLRWRQESARLLRGQGLDSTVLSFVDTAGEDLNDQDTAFTLQYLSVCDALMITLDPFALPGARTRLSLSEGAIQVADGVPLDVVANITELLRTEHKVKKRKKIKLPVAIVFTKIDAFYPTIDRHNPIMAEPPKAAAYQETDGQAVHEHMLALLHEWQADDIDMHMRLNYDDFRYFGVSALGAEPNYQSNAVAPGGVQPHRVEDPVLWLLAKTGTVGAA
jgi:ABC-type dipeptide/oligopeptide/nickel transport system ATPase component